MWWEKTVEYKYILSKVIPKMHLAPMDGRHEALCDTVLSKDDKWLLIEFKRDKNSISAEIGKFPAPSHESFLTAKDTLENHDDHHLIVYGIAAETSGMELKARTYFSNRQIPIDQATAYSCALNEFNHYVVNYLYFKLGENTTSSGSRGINFGIVLGVADDGSISSIRSLSDHFEQFNLMQFLTSENQIEPSNKPTFSPC